MKCLLKQLMIQSIVLSVLITSTSVASKTKNNQFKEEQQKALTINVGLYQWVPRIKQVEKVVARAWYKLHPEIEIKFDQDWDGGYYLQPHDNLDVFVFDAMFLSQFISKDLLSPISKDQVYEIEDFYSYALKEAPENKGLYALPYLGCTNFIFYRKGDQAVANAKSIHELSMVMKKGAFHGLKPQKNKGLMFNLSDALTVSSFYLKLKYDRDHDARLQLPNSIEELDSRAIGDLNTLISLSSQENVTHAFVPFKRAKMFDHHNGRALISYTESMSQMSQATLENIEFNLFPLVDDDSKSIFYADLVGVNSHIKDQKKRDLAVELANLITSTQVIVQSYEATPKHQNPQYVIPLRKSAFELLSQDNAIYSKMKSIFNQTDKQLYALPAGSQEWFSRMQQKISDHLFNSQP